MSRAIKRRSRKSSPNRRRRDEALRKFVLQQMVSYEAGAAVNYAVDLIANMDLVVAWIKTGYVKDAKGRPSVHLVSDNPKIPA